jgi:hypothetical protein
MEPEDRPDPMVRVFPKVKNHFQWKTDSIFIFMFLRLGHKMYFLQIRSIRHSWKEGWPLCPSFEYYQWEDLHLHLVLAHSHLCHHSSLSSLQDSYLNRTSNKNCNDRQQGINTNFNLKTLRASILKDFFAFNINIRSQTFANNSLRLSLRFLNVEH